MPTTPRLKVVPIASKSSSSASWSPVQMLDEFVADVKAGKETPAKMMIFYLVDDGAGGWTPRTWFANCSKVEEIALCELAKARAIDNWKR